MLNPINPRVVASILGLSLTAGLAFAEPTTQPVKAYPLKTCIVSGEELGGDMGEPVVLNYEGREMKFCCNSCVKKFKADPAKYLKALDAKSPTTKPA